MGKRGNEKGVFELRLKNMIMAMGIVLCTALAIVSSLLLGKFIDFLSGRPAFDRDTAIYLIIILSALVLSILASIVLAQFLPLRVQLKKSIEYTQGVMSGLPTPDAFLSGTKKIVEDKRAINVARAEDYYETLFKKRSDGYLSFVTKYKWYSVLATNVPTLLSAFLTAVTIGIAAMLYFDGKATIGTVFVVFQLSQLLQGPLNRCFEIRIYRSINDVHLERINEFEKQQYEPSGFENKYKRQEDLASFSSVKVFASSDKERMLFAADELTLPKNKLILIKGGNGTGKSTFVNLMTGFTNIGILEGRMELDEALQNAAYLSHPILFADGSLEENMFGGKNPPKLLRCWTSRSKTKQFMNQGAI